MFETIFPVERFLINEPMSRHTTFRVGGNADYLAYPKTADELKAALAEAENAGIPARVIGNGSNLLVSDAGFHGLILILSEAMSGITVSDTGITAEAGLSLSRLAKAAFDAGLTGLEFASGIPGSVGGGVYMNAGAYGGSLSDVVEEVTLLGRDGVYALKGTEMEFGYRQSRAKRTGDIVLSASFLLQPGDKAVISGLMSELNARRRDKQPLNFPSAGSTFKRPEGHFAGALIEAAGLKGTSVGGAQVSEKHAGFLINTGTATAQNVLDLIHLVQTRVLEASGVKLEPEVELLGF